MNKQPKTTGEALDLSFARVAAELGACRDVMSQECASMPDAYNPLDAFTEHLVEAMDAIIDAAGVAGTERKARVLRAALQRHGFSLSQ